METAIQPAMMSSEERETRLIEILAELEPLQRRFVSALLEHNTIGKACEVVDVHPATPRNWEKAGARWREAWELGTFDNVLYAKSRLRHGVTKAVDVYLEALEPDQPMNIRMKAADKITEMVIGKAPAKTEISGPDGGPIQIENDFRAVLVAKLDQMGMSQEIMKAVSEGEETVDAEVKEIEDGA